MATLTPIESLQAVTLTCGAGDWVTQLNTNLEKIEVLITALNSMGIEIDTYNTVLDQLLINVIAAKDLAENAASEAATQAANLATSTVNNQLQSLVNQAAYSAAAVNLPALTAADTSKTLVPKTDGTGWKLQAVEMLTNGKQLEHHGKYGIQLSPLFVAPLILPASLELAEIDLFIYGDLSTFNYVVEPEGVETVNNDSDGVTFESGLHVKFWSDGNNWFYGVIA